jgi:hypothetical protein
VDEEYLRMRALYQVDRSLVKVFDMYDRLSAEGNFEGAIEVLQEAMEDLEEENMYGRRDLLRYLYQAHIQAGQDTSAADVLRNMTLLTEQIVGIEERAEEHKDNKGQEYVRKMRENLSAVRASLDEAQRYDHVNQTLNGVLRPPDGSKGKILIPVEGVEQSLRAELLQKGVDPKQIKEHLSVLQTVPLDSLTQDDQ